MSELEYSYGAAKQKRSQLTSTAWKMWESESIKEGIRTITTKYIDQSTTPKSHQRKIWQDMINVAAEVLDE